MSICLPATTAWTATTDADWITLGAESGTGAGTVNVTYTAGTGRTATVTFTAGDLTATCKVTQGTVDLEVLTIAEFIEKPVGDTYYQLTGKITEIQNTTYGNIVIETNNFFVANVINGVIIAKKPGKTTVIIKNNTGRITKNIHVHVRKNTSSKKKILNWFS